MYERQVGFRAYTLHYCINPLPFFCTYQGEPEWVLRGMRGIHVHSAAIAPAECFLYVGTMITPANQHLSPDWDCECGYYGLFQPDLVRTGFGAGYMFIWAQVEGIGAAIIYEHGWRSELYKILRLFWPCTDNSLLNLRDDDSLCYNHAGGKNYMGAITNVLPAIASRLKVPLVKEPLGELLKLGEWGLLAS